MVQARQKPNSEAELLEAFEERLRQLLPTTWSARIATEPGSGAKRADTTLRITAPDGSMSTLPVEVKLGMNTRDVPAVLAQLTAIQREASFEDELGPPLVVSRYLARSTREELSKVGVSYADATGNLKLIVDRPGVYLEKAGASADPWRGPDRETRSLRGKPASRVVRALIDFRPPVGIRELAERAQTSVGSTYRTVDFLDREALIDRKANGGIGTVAWRDLLNRWSEDYGFQKRNSIYAFLEPRGPRTVIEALRERPIRTSYAVTGSLSAIRFSQITEPQSAAVFTSDPKAFAEELGLREATGYPNVLLAAPFDEVVFDRVDDDGGVTYAAPSQTAADLLTGPGREPSEGEALLDWMTRNEDAWRR